MKLEIIDTGDNEDLKIIIDGKELDLKYCVGYEYERLADKVISLKVKYEINQQDIKIKKA